MSKLTVGSLFSGIGGFDLGLERAGFEIKWQVENDPYCLAVLKRHWPNVERLGDVKDVHWQHVERVDVVCGGFPCQPVSNAGFKLVEDDERWLWPEFYRCLRIIRPRFVLVENVPGLLDRGICHVLGGLAALGYDAEWESLPAAAFGAPHIRDRVWILAYTRCESWRFSGVLGNGHYYLFPQRGNRQAQEWREDRELVALVPGVDKGTPADWWRAQSRMDRSAHGVRDWAHRVKALGNAIVPQIAEALGRMILQANTYQPRGGE